MKTISADNSGDGTPSSSGWWTGATGTSTSAPFDKPFYIILCVWRRGHPQQPAGQASITTPALDSDKPWGLMVQLPSLPSLQQPSSGWPVARLPHVLNTVSFDHASGLCACMGQALAIPSSHKHLVAKLGVLTESRASLCEILDNTTMSAISGSWSSNGRGEGYSLNMGHAQHGALRCIDP